VNVATQNNITAVIPTATLRVAAGTGILLTTNSVTSTLTIVATGGSATDQFARDQANTAFTKANTANVTGQAAFDHANSAYSNANTAIYTASQIRANISNTAPVNYDPSTGIISHALSGVAATTYGNTTFVPTITVDDKGHITSVVNTAIALPPSTDEFARAQANAAYAQANTANVTGQAAFDTANTAIYTAAQIRANISNTAPINYDATTGIISHALSGVVATTYGNTTFVPTITVDDKGHITSVANTAIALPPSTDEFARAQANAAFNQANTANVTGQAAFDRANAGFTLATTANTVAAAAYSQANIATTNADAAFAQANAAYSNANSAIYTATQIRANIGNTAPINYDSTTGVISHALSGAAASGYGDAATVPKVVVDDKGHVTSVTNTAIAISAAAITSGTLGVARGGTGQTAITVNGSLLIGNTVSGGFDVNALTQGSGILITNDKGSVTIAATGGAAGNSFGRIAVAGQSNVIAHMANDVVNLVGGTGIALTTDISTNSVTITATGGSSIDQFARDHGNGAFDQANTANVTGQAAFDKANTANVTGQAAFDKANTANVTGQAAFDKANSAIYTAAQIRANISNAYPVFYNAATGVVSFVPATANGQTLIGNTVSGTFDVSTLSQGTGVTIVNGKGTITLSAADAFASQQANAAYAQANIATTNADAGFAKANSANVTGQAAFDKANSAIYTAAQIRANISNTAPVNYDPSTGIVSFVAASANGQTLIGNTVSGTFDVSVIAQTAPVIVVNGKGTITLSHASSGVAAAVYGNASIIPSITVDAFGHITGAVNTTVAISAAQITSGTLAVARGGTGQTAITVNGSLLIGNTVSGGFDVNALTQGTGILITNDKGSITIAATGGSAVDQYARDHSNGAFDKANTANTTADAAFNQANTANVTGQAAFDKANSAIYTAAQIRANISNTYPVYYNATTGVVSFVPATANGQTLIGNTVSGTFDVSVIAQTAPVIVVNGKGTVTLSHASSGVAAATYGGSNRVIGYTVDQFGHITTATNVSIDLLDAGVITTGILSVARGGTGKDATGLANGQLLIGNTVNTGFDLATLTQGTGVTITNDKGSITLAAADAFASQQANAAFARANAAYSNANTAIYTAAQIRANISNAQPILYDNITGIISLNTVPVANGGTGYTSYSNGDLLIGNTMSGGLDRSNLTQGSGISIIRGNGDITIAALTGVVYYLENGTLSDVGVYHKALTVPSALSENTITHAATGTLSYTLLSSFITASGQPGVTQLPPGTYGRHVHATTGADNQVGRLRVETYKYAANGLETLLRTADSPDFWQGFVGDLLTWNVTIGTGAPLELTDRLLLKLYAARVSGPATCNIDIFSQGTDRASYISTTILGESERVVSVAGRTGAVVLNTNDVSENAAGPYYFTAAKVRANISNTYPVYYNNTTGVVSFVPSTANGQTLIGNTVSGTFDVALIAQTAPVIVTNGKGTVTLSHASSGVAAATYGGSNRVIGYTVDTFGHITTATNVAIDLLDAGVITTGILTVARGGTGKDATGIVNGSILVGNTINVGYDVTTIAQTAPVIVVNGKGTITLSHASSGVAAATYGGSNRVIGYTVDQFGHITTASNVAIDQLPASAITTGILTVARGGTGKDATGLVNGQILIGNTVNSGFDLAGITQTAPVIVSTDKGSIRLSHARSGVTAATYGSASLIPVITVDDNGHITVATTATASSLPPATTNGQLLVGNTVSSSFDVYTPAQSAPIIVTVGKGTIVYSHARSGVVAVDSYGSGAIIPVLAIDANGHITAAVNTAVAISAAAITSGTLVQGRGGTGFTGSTANGQTLIGNTVSGGFDLATLTAGTGININNLKGSIEIVATGGSATDQFARDTANGAFTKANGAVQTGFVTFNVARYNVGAYRDVVADSNTDIITLVGGRGVILRTNANSDTLTINTTSDLQVSMESAVIATNTWTSRAVSSNLWQSVVWSPELAIFVAVNNDGGATPVMTSPDGITWTTRTAPVDDWKDLAWSPELGLFAAVSTVGTTIGIMTSSNGIVWNTRTTPANSWSAIAWSPELGLFAAVNSDGGGTTQGVATSVNGITWTSRTTPANVWSGIAWSSELRLFAAVNGDTTTQGVATSPDGIVWTNRTTPVSSWTTIGWSPELGIFTALTGGGTTSMYSTDGVIWTAGTVAANVYTGMAWSSELKLFAATFNDGVGGVQTSPDGINWTNKVISSHAWEGIAWSPALGIFAAVNSDGGPNGVIMTSKKMGVYATIDDARETANGAFTKANGAVQTGFVTIAVAGQSNVVADSNTDTLTLVAGTNMTITTVAGTDTITFTASGGGGSGISLGLGLAASRGYTMP
jgi:hypothetical protein